MLRQVRVAVVVAVVVVARRRLVGDQRYRHRGEYPRESRDPAPPIAANRFLGQSPSKRSRGKVFDQGGSFWTLEGLLEEPWLGPNHQGYYREGVVVQGFPLWSVVVAVQVEMD